MYRQIAILVLGLQLQWLVAANGMMPPDFGERLYESQCVNCHGAPGLQQKAPIILGMEESYIYDQLNAFAQGTRKDRLMFVMNEWAEGLSDEEKRSLARYIANGDPCSVPRPPAFRDGDKSIGATLFKSKGCIACHDGTSQVRARLERQKGVYLLHALTSFEKGWRTNEIMQNMVNTISREERVHIVKYLSSKDFCRVGN